jgi:hypothetical protein
LTFLPVLGVAVLLGSSAHAEEEVLPWSSQVGGSLTSPAPADGPTAPLYAACGERMTALEGVAARLLGDGPGPRPSAVRIARSVQAAGVPQPGPRAWAYSGPPGEALPRFQAWLGSARGTRRCGVVHAVGRDGATRFAAVGLDALADLAPLPRRVRVGAWVTLDARLLVEATEAAVVLLPPDGGPKRVLADLSGQRARSRFAVDQPGEWAVQVLATLPGGPEPVAEARLFVGVEPRPEPPEPTPLGLPDDEVLVARLDAARRAAGLSSLRRSAELDAVAARHAARMTATNTLAHDVGEGAPTERVRASGVAAAVVGENVARAADAEAAHRALWDSPSHRGNMLSRRFGRVGVGVVRDARGVWVTQLFAD